MPFALRSLAARVPVQLAFASLLPACAAPEAGEDTGATTTLEPTSTTQIGPDPTQADPTTSTAGTTSGAGPTGDPVTIGDTGDTGSTGEPLEPTWLRSFGAPDGQTPGGLGLAEDGTLWVAGDFYKTMDLGLGPLTGEGTGLYLAHYSATGESLFSTAIFPADGQPTLTQVSGLGVDSGGNVVITGWLEGTYKLGGDTLTANEIDVHVARWDAEGQPLWGQRFGEADWQVPYGLAVGADDSIWISGASLAPFMVGDIELTGMASTGMFVIRLDPDGAPIFARWYGEMGDQEARSIAVCDDGSAAITGFFTAPLTFGADTIEPLVGKDMFIARIDAQGEPLWIRAITGTGTEYGTQVDCDTEITFAGVVTGDATIGDLEIAAGGAADVVLGRYDLDGALTWITAITGGEDQSPTGLARLPGGATAIVLTTSGATQLGDQQYPSGGQTDVLFAVYPADATSPTQSIGLGDREAQSAGPLATNSAGVTAIAATLAGAVEWPELPPITATSPEDLGLVRFVPAP